MIPIGTQIKLVRKKQKLRACEVAHVPYFFKQIDKIKPIPPELLIRQFPII